MAQFPSCALALVASAPSDSCSPRGMLPFAPRAHVACHSCPLTSALASLTGPAWCLSWLASLRVGPWCFFPLQALTWLSSLLGLLHSCFHRPACSVGCHRGGACPSWGGRPGRLRFMHCSGQPCPALVCAFVAQSSLVWPRPACFFSGALLVSLRSCPPPRFDRCSLVCALC